ncbi:vWA domain-containing protein [Domibacillus robiginosus]|uniref:vWA domain-containing protein n=1 Tax=Domibacillus robiginosus TaxID=1071054 RepID=UPI00067CAF40|nr:vWA domain-containing protein [Domibacillus robiginosus]
MKKFIVNILLFIMVGLLILPHDMLQAEAAGNDIGVSVTATPSQSIVVKPVDSNAKARIDMKMTPFGKYDQLDRKPVDVVFIFDTSGSMNESGKRKQKFESAKAAMYKALDYFKENAGPNDRFAFIPFNTTVDDNGNVVPLTKASNITFSTIRSKVYSTYALGGTNYRDPIELAQQMLSGSTNDKNIIFMTDGFLTASTETIDFERKCVEFKRNGNCQRTDLDYSKPIKEVVHFYDYDNGVFIQYNNSYRYNLEVIYDNQNKSRSTDSRSDRLSLIRYIKERAKNTAQQIGQNGIKMYSIGFGNNRDELDQGYLEELSSVTGAYASAASEGNVDQIFLDIAESISKQKLDAEVTLDLAKFGSKVTVAEGANAAVDGTKVTLRKSFEYEYLQNAPAPVDLTLPLEFSEVGTYTFDNMKLTYKRPDGSTVSITIPSVTIQVAAEAPPAINGSMVLKGEANEVNNLIKQSGKRTNYFNAEYSLKPEGLSSKSVSGKLQNMKLIQLLPDGVSIEPAEGVTVRDEASGGKEAVITLSRTVSYANGVFNPASFTTALKLKADWALNNVTMPQARIEYEDTRFKQTYSSSIPAASDRITNKVRLDDGGSYYYDGYANGIIRKVEKATGLTVAETAFPNDYGLLPKPVKDMVFAGNDKKAITITYFDNTTATLYFTADVAMTGAESKTSVANKSTVYENVNAKLSQLVGGENVQYSYRIDNGNWQPLGEDQVIELTKPGLNKIDVKSTGGFSLTDQIVSKEVTIAKKVEQIEIWSTGDDPKKIDQVSIVEGTAMDFEVRVFPEDATDQSWKVDVTSGGEFAGAQKKSDKKEEMNGTVFGLKEGVSEFTVTSNSNPDAKVTMPVNVTSDFIPLEGVSFEQAKYTNKESELVDNLLDITPSDATEPDVVDVRAADDGVVIIKKEANGDWYIESDKSGKGYTDVTATVTQEQPDGSIVTKEATTVFETGNDSGGESADSIDGRW